MATASDSGLQDIASWQERLQGSSLSLLPLDLTALVSVQTQLLGT